MRMKPHNTPEPLLVCVRLYVKDKRDNKSNEEQKKKQQ